MAISLKILSEEYSILSLDDLSVVNREITSSNFWFVAIRSGKLTLVCNSLIKVHHQMEDKGWKCFEVLGPLDLSLTGVLESILKPLADATISIFSISTFETDFVLVKSENEGAAISALSSAGFSISKDGPKSMGIIEPATSIRTRDRLGCISE